MPEIFIVINTNYLLIYVLIWKHPCNLIHHRSFCSWVNLWALMYLADEALRTNGLAQIIYLNPGLS